MKVQKACILGCEVNLKFTEHALDRMHHSNISLDTLLDLMKKKKGKIVGKSHGSLYIIQIDSVQLVLDAISFVVKTVIVTTVDRIFISNPKMEVCF